MNKFIKLPVIEDKQFVEVVLNTDHIVAIELESNTAECDVPGKHEGCPVGYISLVDGDCLEVTFGIARNLGEILMGHSEATELVMSGMNDDEVVEA